MTTSMPREKAAVVGRLLVLSAVVMFALSLVFWNDVLPSLGVTPEGRPLIAGALLVAGLFDLGVAIFMFRRAR